MNTTIPLAFVSTDEAARSVWTDDEDLSDSDPLADRAAFVAYLYADEDDQIDYHNVYVESVWQTTRSALASLDTMHGH
jgi:hypothetical protein